VATLLKLLRTLTVLALLAGLALAAWLFGRARPEDVPWTELDLAQPIGMFTGSKLTALGGDAPRCRALLDQAGVRYTALPPRRDGAQCGYDDGVRFTAGGPRRIAFRPADLGIGCPVAAALAVWEWEVVQPAAVRIYGQRVAAMEHFGSYSCRRLYGRDQGAWSEHARARAVDIAGFRLEGGRRVTVAADWNGGAQDRAFLRAVRDGACRLFATTLSPDYNAAHRDHLHLDQAQRGAGGWRACR
jgi:hypothetical protein